MTINHNVNQWFIMCLIPDDHKHLAATFNKQLIFCERHITDCHSATIANSMVVGYGFA